MAHLVARGEPSTARRYCSGLISRSSNWPTRTPSRLSGARFRPSATGSDVGVARAEDEVDGQTAHTPMASAVNHNRITMIIATPSIDSSRPAGYRAARSKVPARSCDARASRYPEITPEHFAAGEFGVSMVR